MIFDNDYKPNYGPPPAARGPTRKCEETIAKQRLDGDNQGPFAWSKWRFDKRRTYRDRMGATVVQVPYTEILFLLTKFKSSVWLTAREWEALSGWMESHQGLMDRMR